MNVPADALSAMRCRPRLSRMPSRIEGIVVCGLLFFFFPGGKKYLPYRVLRPRLLATQPRRSGIVLDMRPQLGDRAEAHRPLRQLRLDRSVGVERIGHAVDHAGFEDGGLARLLLL